MSNMSYCRFHNTLSDLQDCRDAMDSMQENRHNVAILAELKERFDHATEELERHDKAPMSERDEDWEETYEELNDRVDELCEEMDNVSEELSPLSKEEYGKACALLDLCREIADTFEEDDLIEEVQS